MFDLTEFKTDYLLVSEDIKMSAEKFKTLDMSSKLDEKNLTKAKNQLEENQKQQKEDIKYLEDDKKKYKALQKYGYILEKVQGLINIIPSNLEDLSLNDLNASLEKLITNRKKIHNQTGFTFFQNLFSDIINNVLQIEKDFQEGKISPKDSLEEINKLQTKLEDNEQNLPDSLTQNYKNIKDLLYKYTKNIAKESNPALNPNKTPLKETDLTLEHQYELEKLNNASKALLVQTENLHTSLSEFQPQVKLDALITSLSDTKTLLTNPNWNADQLSYKCTDIEVVTNNLTNEQVQKNMQHEKLKTEINEVVLKSDELGTTTINTTISEVMKQAKERSKNYIKSSDEIIEILEIDENFPVDVAVTLKNTLLTQLETDTNLAEKLSKNPELIDIIKLDLKNEDVSEKLVNLTEYIEKLELELGTVNIYKYDEDDTDKK